MARAAIVAVGALKKRSMIGELIERLAEPALTATHRLRPRAVRRSHRRHAARRDHRHGDARRTMRREIPKVLEEIGTPAAQAVLVESVLDRDVVLRYHTIAALNRLGQAHPERAHRSQADRDRAGRRDHGPLPLLPGARHAQRRPRRPGQSDRARPARVDGEGDRADFPPAQDAVSAVRPAQRLRRPAVDRSGGARQRGRVHGFGAAAGSARADDSAVRSRGDRRSRASPPPIACSGRRSAIARKRSR